MNKQETAKEKSTVPVAITTRVREKKPCSCKKCNGKLVDPRTKRKHEAFISNMKESRGKRVKSTPINLPNSRFASVDVEPMDAMDAGCSQNLREDVIDSDKRFPKHKNK